MIINIFLPKKYKLTYNDIQEFSNIAVLLVSLFTTYNIYFLEDYLLNTKIIYYYTITDTFFLSYDKKEFFLHHILTILHILYIFYYNIDLNISSYSSYSAIQIFKVEISSVFLSLSKLFKYYKIKNNFSKILEYIFLITFLKYRIIDFYNNVITNDLFYINLNGYDNFYRYYYLKINTVSFFIINIYWSILIFKILYLKVLKNKINKIK